MDGSVQRHFWDFVSVDPDQTPQNALLFFTVQDFVLQIYFKQKQNTPPKFKIVLSNGILRTFANGAASDQNAESDQVHHCLRPN